MSFKTRQIRKKPPLKLRSGPASTFLKKIQNLPQILKKGDGTSKTTPWRYAWIALLVVFAAWVVIRVTIGAYRLITDFEGTVKDVAGEVVEVIATDLKTDENGYTNIVLLGDGGYAREGAGLVDTIIGVSIDHEKEAVSMLSIPRDYYYLNTPYAKANPNYFGIGKINEVFLAYDDGDFNSDSYEAYQEVIKDIVDLEFHYFIRVDFNAFVEIVDSLGGVEVDVQQAIYDSKYPNKTDTGPDPFRVEAGLQVMDGETALKYARSRHNQYAASGDFDRAARQQQLLSALQQKALSRDVLTSPKTLKAVFDSIQDNMSTNMEWRELVALAEFGAEFDRSNLVMKVLNDDWNSEGGFLGNGNRDVYGGAVLLPAAGDLDEIHRYTDLIFNHRELYLDLPKVQILNATKTPGLAGEVRYELNRLGLNVVDVGNYLGPDDQRMQLDETMLLYYSWSEQEGQVVPTYHAYIDLLSNFLPFVPLPANLRDLDEDFDLVLVLGNDYEELHLE